MTLQEIVEQIAQLSLEDQSELMEILKQRFPEADEDEAVDIHAEFRQAWREAMAGEEIPLSDLWKAVNDE